MKIKEFLRRRMSNLINRWILILSNGTVMSLNNKNQSFHLKTGIRFSISYRKQCVSISALATCCLNYIICIPNTLQPPVQKPAPIFLIYF